MSVSCHTLPRLTRAKSGVKNGSVILTLPEFNRESGGRNYPLDRSQRSPNSAGKPDCNPTRSHDYDPTPRHKLIWTAFFPLFLYPFSG